MKVKNFKIRIIKGKNSADATEPQQSVNEGLNGEKGRYYHVSVLSEAELVTVGRDTFRKPTQGKPISFVVFESGTRQLVFNELYDILGDPENYTVSHNGDIVIKPSSLAFGGNLIAEQVDFQYYMTDGKGEKIINPVTKAPILRSSIQAFIFDFEDESGMTDLIMAAEERRAMRNIAESAEETETKGAGAIDEDIEEEKQQPAQQQARNRKAA